MQTGAILDKKVFIGPCATWPVETDLVLTAGSKVSLLSQRPIVRAIIQEGIENLRAALLFTNAFPDVCNALTLIKDCLLTAALHLKPCAAAVLERLKYDQDYLLMITPLVSVTEFEIALLTLLPSHVPVFACFEARSRNAAALLRWEYSCCLAQVWTSSITSADSYLNIRIPSRRLDL